MTINGIPDPNHPGPGWRWVERDAEWVRDDNRVIIKRIGGKWKAFVRAERHIMWDRIERGEAKDDGRRLYLAAGEHEEQLRVLAFEVGAMFAVLDTPLPEPEPLPKAAGVSNG